MRRCTMFVTAVLLSSGPVLAQASEVGGQAANLADAGATPKAAMKRVCRMKDSGNPMRPDRVCRMVPVAAAVSPADQPLPPAPRVDQVAQNASAPQF